MQSLTSVATSGPRGRFRRWWFLPTALAALLAALILALLWFGGSGADPVSASERRPGRDFDSLGTNNTAPVGIWSDGTTMWVADADADKIFTYKLADGTRIRTSDPNNQDFNTLSAAGNTGPTGIWSDETTMWVADTNEDKIYAYKMSDKSRDPGKDFNTLSAAANNNPRGMWSDGTTMWVADSADDKIYAYKMSDKSHDSGKDFNTLSAAGNDSAYGIWSDGTTMWVADQFDQKIYAYKMSDKSHDSGKDFNTLIAADNDNPRGLWSDGETMWVADLLEDKIYAYALPNMFVTIASPTSLKVTWDPGPANTTDYIVQWKTGAQRYSIGERNSGEILATADRSYTITGLTGGTEYSVQVRAHDKGIAPPEGILVRRERTIRLFTLSAEVLDTGRALKATWPTVADAVNGYNVHWKSGNQAYDNSRRHQVAAGADPSQTVSGLDAGIEYTLRVRGLDASRAVVAEAEATATPTLAKVTGLSVTEAERALKLSWDAVSQAGGYVVQWKADGEGYDASSRQATPTTNSYTISSLTTGTQYTVRVRATHATRTAATGPWSDEATGTPPYPPIPGLSWSVASKTSVKIDWDTYTGSGTVHRYGVRWKTSGQDYIDYATGWGSNSRSRFTLSGTTETTITGLTTGTTYTVQVQAYTSGAEILAQSEVAATPVDKPGYVLSKETLTIAEGASDTLTISLQKQPTSRVRIAPTDHGRRFTAETTSGETWLTFDTNNWSAPQSVTVRAVQDMIAWDSSKPVRVRWVVRTADEGYIKANFPKAVKVTITDDDTAGVEVDLDPDTAGIQHTRTVDEGHRHIAGANGEIEYTIRLKSKPAFGATSIYVNSTGGIIVFPPSDLPGYDGNLITFNDRNWNERKKVRVLPGGSHYIDNHRQATITHTLPETDFYNRQALYAGVSVPTLTLTVNDTSRDHVGFVSLTGTLRVRPGSTHVYQIIPKVVPTANVTVTLTSSDTSKATIDTDPDTAGNQSMLTFRPEDFDAVPVSSNGVIVSYAYPKRTAADVGLVSVTGVATGMVTVSVTAVSTTDPYYAAVMGGGNQVVDVGTGPRYYSPPKKPSVQPQFSQLPEGQTATVGQNFAYTVPEAIDALDVPLTYTASLADGGPLPSWLSFAPGSRAFSGMPGRCDAPAELEVMVRATNRGRHPLSDAVTFTVTVQPAAEQPAADEAPDRNLPPVFEEPVCPRAIPENSGGGVKVGGPIVATDPNGDELMYLTLDGKDGEFFNLDAKTGQITTKDGVDYDYEKRSSYGFMLVVMELETEEQNLSGVWVTVGVTDVDETVTGNAQGNTGQPQEPDPPANLAPAFDANLDTTLSVDENSAAGTNVGAPITATDPDAGDTVAYSLSGDDAASFGIDATGQITTVADVSYDYETDSSYSLAVEASDGKGGTASIALTINLNDVNEAPSFAASSATREVAENSAAGTNVGSSVTATDPDTGDTLTYSLSGADASSFEIGSSTGQITTKSGETYDYEKKKSYSLTVKASDGKLSASIAVTVNLTDVGTPVAACATDLGTLSAMAEYAGAWDDAECKAHHQDSLGRYFQFTLSADTKVSISLSAGTLYVSNDTPNNGWGTEPGGGYEHRKSARRGNGKLLHDGPYAATAENDGNTVTLTLEAGPAYTVETAQAPDGGDGFTLTVSPTGVNEAPTFDANLDTTLEVAENSAAGTNVGSPITATDPDSGDTLTYSLSGTDAASFAIGASTGQITTVADVTYDYEADSSYSLTVEASDGKLSASVAVTVTLTDVNEAPSFAASTATRSVAENSAAGTNVGAAVTATDPDSGDTLAYSLSGTDASSFAIGASTGQITTIADVTYDYEADSSYSLTVEASDGKLSASIAVTVNLTNVEETDSGPSGDVEPDEPANRDPSFAASTATRSVEENSAGGTNVGTAVTATDPDAGDTLTYSLSGTDASSFAIGASTGQITTKTGETYDYEKKKSYSLTVKASDGKLSVSIAVTVNLTDVGTPVTACETDLGTLSAMAEYAGAWDDAECKAHHQDSLGRYFQFTLSADTRVSISLTGGTLYVSKGTPKNGWGTTPGGGYEHRKSVRRDNGNLVHDGSNTATLMLAAGETYTVEAAGSSGNFTVNIAP